MVHVAKRTHVLLATAVIWLVPREMMEPVCHAMKLQISAFFARKELEERNKRLETENKLMKSENEMLKCALLAVRLLARTCQALTSSIISSGTSTKESVAR